MPRVRTYLVDYFSTTNVEMNLPKFDSSAVCDKQVLLANIKYKPDLSLTGWVDAVLLDDFDIAMEIGSHFLEDIVGSVQLRNKEFILQILKRGNQFVYCYITDEKLKHDDHIISALKQCDCPSIYIDFVLNRIFKG